MILTRLFYRTKKFTAFKAMLIISIITSCSSAPKRPMEVRTVYQACSQNLETAKTFIASGTYESAGTSLKKNQNLDLSIDNYDLLISTKLSFISLYLSLESPDIQAARKCLNEANAYIPNSDKPQRNMALYTLAKLRIVITSHSDFDYKSLMEELKEAEKYFSGEAFYKAQCQSISGDLNRINGDYKEADKHYQEAVKLFTSERYLSEIGITWYKIAQNRSLSGDKKSTLEALEKAIYYDRCAENSVALGSDYYIKGVILLKGKTCSKF